MESCHTWMSDVLYECFITHFCDAGQVMELHQLRGFNTIRLHAWHGFFTYDMTHSYVIQGRWRSWIGIEPSSTKIPSEWVMSRMKVWPSMNVLHHIWTSHVSYEWVTTHRIESCHVSLSHELNVNESRAQYGSRMGHVPHMNESRHIWMSRVTYHWVISMSHKLNMGHIPHMNESWHI